MQIDENTMWKATIENNSKFDGVFYYAVKSTKIFCRPSCKSKVPLRKNVCFFEDIEAAINSGFRPCKRCQPDLFSCTKDGSVNDLKNRIDEILELEYKNPYVLVELHNRVGFSKSHMQRLYKSETGETPKVFLQKLRINKAKELIKENKMDNTEICYEVGFRSSSCFYEAFKLFTGVTPGEYRQSSKQNS